MENLTNEQIENLLTLADAATPGPWTAWEGQTSVFYGTAEKNSSREYLPSGNDLLEICQTDNCREEDTEDVQPGDPADDAAYIAAANPTTLRRLLLELQQHRATAATPAAARCGRGCGVGREAWVPAHNGPQPHEEDYTLHVLTADGGVANGHYFKASEAEYFDEDPTPGWFYWGAEDTYERYTPQPTHYHPLPASPTTAAAAGAPEAGEEA